MANESFVFTIFFLTLGPIKVIPAFAKLTKQASPKFKREVAIRSTLVATAIVAMVALLGRHLLTNYSISFAALEIAAGIVLLISALEAIFPKWHPPHPQRLRSETPTAMQLAISPVATPIVVPPVGIAAILIFVMLNNQNTGVEFAVGKALALMMALDFLVMYFIDAITRIPGLFTLLQIMGTVLVFLQVALGIEAILGALRILGLIKELGHPN